MFKIIRNTGRTVEQMFRWRYEEEYDFYNFSGTKSEKAELLSKNSFSVFDSSKNLLGFCVFGQSAVVESYDKTAYENKRLDIGFGLAPEFSGRGLGESFVKAIMDFGEKTYSINRFRLTVASFNKRAIKCYEKIGFTYFKTVEQIGSKNSFIIMIYN